jgi:hypothetical protein
VNTHGVKPVGFSEFVKAVRHLGFFGAAINLPPLPAAKGETLGSQHQDH